MRSSHQVNRQRRGTGLWERRRLRRLGKHFVFSTLLTAPTAAIYPFPTVVKPAVNHNLCLN
jgi:hypothetical protein